MTITPAEHNLRESFFLAVYDNDCQTARNILTGPIVHDDGSTSLYDPNMPTNSKNDTALHLAVNKKHHEMIGLLLQFGGDPNRLNGHGLSPFHIALAENPLRDIELFLLKGADINTVIPYCDLTPLQVVTASGKSEDLFFSLVRAGARTDILTEQGESLLHLAAMSGQTRIAHYLVHHEGLDLGSRNSAGETPADLAGTQLMRDVLQSWKRMKDSKEIKERHIARLRQLDKIGNRRRRPGPA